MDEKVASAGGPSLDHREDILLCAMGLHYLEA